MKLLVSFLFLIIILNITANGQKYKHKSETEIERMTAAERVDEWLNERLYHWSNAHDFDVDDKQNDLIQKYIYLDKLKALPRIIETIDRFDPSRKNKRSIRERFDDAIDLLRFIDCFSIRLRASDEGRLAISAIEQSIKRMRAAGFVTGDEKTAREEWKGERHGLLESAEGQLKQTSGINFKDDHIRDTLRYVYKINMSDEELLDFSNFLTARDPEYPSWSTGIWTKDPSKLGPAGYPVQIILLKQPERYYEAYQSFKKPSPM